MTDMSSNWTKIFDRRPVTRNDDRAARREVRDRIRHSIEEVLLGALDTDVPSEEIAIYKDGKTVYVQHDSGTKTRRYRVVVELWPAEIER